MPLELTIELNDRIVARSNEWFGGFGPDTFQAAIDAAGPDLKTLTLRILSEGGETIGGNAIARKIQQLKDANKLREIKAVGSVDEIFAQVQAQLAK